MWFNNMYMAALLSCAVAFTSATRVTGKPGLLIPRQQLLQDIVTWDNQSIFVRGERILFYSGEYHPFRLPVPGLWLDIFQKIKALGYNGVSFYTDWALLEGKPGNFSAEGVFSFDVFFEAAQTAGIYLLARPGPYINAEVSGGGFPGWLQRSPGIPRTRDPAYEHATDNYAYNMNKIIAGAQITNGGPVILIQPENEYTYGASPDFPDAEYFAYVEQQQRNAGVIVPFISNDANPAGNFAPGKPSAVDIYGFDGYPLGFDCAHPYTWPNQDLPTYYLDAHLTQSPSTPFSVIEFQGGSFDPWGGPGFRNCLDLISYEFERVFYKNLFSFGMTVFNIYMTYGGTNWGNLGHPGGYTSYDYAAVISEDRTVSREKYSEAKLIANFVQSSPAYWTAISQNNHQANGSYTGNDALAVTALFDNTTKFFVIRHAAYNTVDTTNYNITLPTSAGNITVPQLGGQLSLHGRDSKFHVSDYDIGGINLLYSTAEIFTWKQYGDKRVLVVYGGPSEEHELAVSNGGHATVIEGSGVKHQHINGATIINYQTGPKRRIVELSCNLYIYLLDRNSAYNYWVIDLPNDVVSGNHTNQTYFSSTPIVKAGYLLRTVEKLGTSVHLTGDLNATTPIEVVGGAPSDLKQLTFNGKSLQFEQDQYGVVTATAQYTNASYSLPDLSRVGWKVINSLPEIQPVYDDSLWTEASLTYSNNTARNLSTPRSLYSSDYGYHTGNLLYRGHFTATGFETSLYLATQGGTAFGSSAWLNGTFLGSFRGTDRDSFGSQVFNISQLSANCNYVITVLVDNNGLDENYESAASSAKNPRGIMDYDLSGHIKSDIRWKVTGNLGGEDYRDHTRGPLNEGGLYAERQGYHLPGAPTESWANSAAGPMDGISSAGVSFYATTFHLDMPQGFDIPVAFSFTNGTSLTAANNTAVAYRCQIYVNGYQFGKYVHNIGPQNIYPVPEGIWNYHGLNYIAVSLWSLEASGAKVDSLSLVGGPVIQSGYGNVELSPMPGYEKRAGAY
ncbi:hypothetical protein LTR49_022134 [Elasticomyces elasticus]|nr:hypothetical protein LTR49_022134 [Elasticomyces elasticus]